MGIIGLDYPAVYAEATRLTMDLSLCTMKKIKRLERVVLESVRDD